MSFIRPGRALIATVASGGTSTLITSIGFDAQTPEQISIYCPTLRSAATGTTIAVEYRVSGVGASYVQAHPLLHINPSWVSVSVPPPVTVVDAFAGSIFDLTPGVTYDIRLTIVEPGQSDATLTTTRATRALPAVAGAATKTATTADNLQTKLDSLVPGDVLELAAGTYTVSGLQMQVSGTSGSPIYIRGVDRDTVIIKDTTGYVLQILDGSHFILEDLTLEGSSTDSGTSSSSSGISFWDGAPGQTNVTIRRVTFNGVDMGVWASAAVNGCLIYECILNGNNPWSESFGSNTWNDDGIRLPGSGNCAWNNTLSGFGDSFAVNDGVTSSAVFYYRNYIEMTGDDAFEGDYGTRNIAFYDNWIGNSATLFSVDPVWGGPVYCFRNVSLNSYRGPYKFNTGSSGNLIYNNTVVKSDTDPTSPAGIYTSSGSSQRQWVYRNNLLIFRNGGTDFTFGWDATVNDPIDFDHNGWYPNSTSASTFRWAGGGYANLAAALAGLAATTPVFSGLTQRHTSDVITVSNPFINTLTLGSDYTTEYTGGVISLALSGGDAAKNTGVSIPGITDGYTGSAPDMGAHIAGRSIPAYGDTVITPAWMSGVSTGVWKQIASTTLDGYVTPGGFTVNALILGAYSGFGIKESSSRVFFRGGGHNDYSGNEVIGLDLEDDSPALFTICEPSDVGDRAYGVAWWGTVPNQKANNAHTYDSALYSEALDRYVWTGQSSPYGPGGGVSGSDRLWSMSSSGVWIQSASDLGALPSGGIGRQTCQDSSGNIYICTATGIQKYVVGSGWSSLTSGTLPSGSGYQTLVYDSLRNKILRLGNFPEGLEYWTIDCATGSVTDVQSSLSGTGSVVSDLGGIVNKEVPAACYDVPNDRYLVASGNGAQLYAIDAGTWVVTVFTPSTVSGTVPNSDHYPSEGLWGRLKYVPRMRGVVYFPKGDAPGWFMRTA